MSRAAFLVALAAMPLAPQEGHHLERLPAVAVLAEGRVVESSQATLMMETRDVSARGRGGLADYRTHLDLTEAEGFVYFMEADEELPLRDGLRRLQPGDWVETAAMPDREFSRWVTRGTDSSFSQEPQRGFEPLAEPQATAAYIGVRGWLYVWVVAEGPRKP